MANTKASDIVTLKKMIRSRGKEAEKILLDRLTPEAVRLYQTVAANNWVPLGTEAEILATAADVLFAREAAPIKRLGYEIAKINFTGLYKVFLLMATIPFVIKRVPQIWGTLLDQGQAKVEDVNADSGTLVILGLPELQAVQREYISGFVTGLLELAGAKQVQVVKVEANPQAWVWKLKWIQPNSVPPA